MSSVLSGRRILLTRPEGQAKPLLEHLQALGAQAHHFPAIKITLTLPDKSDLNPLEQATFVIFVSTNAVRGLMEVLSKYPDVCLAAGIAAIGPATAEILKRFDLGPVIVAPPPHNSEALLSMRMFQTLEHQHVIIVRGQSGREKLAEVLRNRGATIDYLEVYRREPSDAELSFKKIWGEPPDAICITSAEVAENLLQCIVPEEKDVLLQCPFIAGNRRILNACLGLGYTALPGIANNPGDDAMIEALKTYFSPEPPIS